MPSDEAPIPKTPADAQPDPWAPPQDHIPAPPAPRAEDATPAAAVVLDKPAVPVTGPVPPPAQVHDGMTVASVPGAEPGVVGPQAGPGGPTPTGVPTAPVPSAGPGPFAPPGGPWPTPPSAPSPGPFAPPVPHLSYPPPSTGVPHAPVPPPPLSPDGPGQPPYGRPHHPTAYPAGHLHPGFGLPAPVVGHFWPATAPPPSNGIGIAAMVLGICAAALFCLWPLAILLGIMAVIFGSVGRVKARRGEATNPGHALAGIICGAVGILLGIGIIVLLVVAPGSGDFDPDPAPIDDGYSTSLSPAQQAGTRPAGAHAPLATADGASHRTP